MKPEDRKKFEEMWAAYLTETMALRQQIAKKRIEMETLRAQPDIDRAKIDKLSSELAELYTERMKKCDDYKIARGIWQAGVVLPDSADGRTGNQHSNAALLVACR